MADTNHQIPTEGDGISYSALGWSMVVLAVVTLVCYGIVWGFYLFFESRSAAADTPRNALAGPAVTPSINDGRIASGNQSSTPLLVDEPRNLKLQRTKEHDTLNTYGWVDRNAGTVRVPIDVAKDLVLKHGLDARGGGQ
jgi:hypothetical protein